MGERKSLFEVAPYNYYIYIYYTKEFIKFLITIGETLPIILHTKIEMESIVHPCRPRVSQSQPAGHSWLTDDVLLTRVALAKDCTTGE